jgi:hypothetical protein
MTKRHAKRNVRKARVSPGRYRPSSKRPHEVKLQTNLKGVWKFKGEKPIPFEFLRNGKTGLRLRVEVPEVMGERAWRAFSRFLMFNFNHVREKLPAWLKKSPEYLAWRRTQRRKKWRRRYPRKPPQPKKVATPIVTAPDDTPEIDPSSDLQAVAKAVLEATKGNP